MKHNYEHPQTLLYSVRVRSNLLKDVSAISGERKVTCHYGINTLDFVSLLL